jgi:predicted nucleic acid-binding protein
VIVVDTNIIVYMTFETPQSNQVALLHKKNPNEHRIGPHHTMELLATSMCSSYDCEFIALADQLNTMLITYDKLILKEFPEIAIKPEGYLAQLK